MHLVLASGLLTFSDFYADIGNQILFYVMLGVGLNLLLGYAGEISMAQATFYGVGGYTAARLALAPGSGGITSRGVTSGLGWNIYQAGGMAILVAFVFALVISIPATLRVRGEYLILLTLAFQLVANDLMNSLDNITGGPYGLTPIGPLTLPWGTALLYPHQVFWPLLILTLIVAAVAWMIGESPFGRILKGIREQETATRAVGKNTVIPKLLVFGIAAGISGLAGALNGFYLQTISPTTYTLDLSIFVVAVVVLGGSGNMLGTILAAVLLGSLRPILQSTFTADSAVAWQAVIYGAALVLLVRFRPAGLLPEGTGVFPLARRLLWRFHGPMAHPAEIPMAVAAKELALPSADASSRDGATTAPILRVEGMSKRFGGLQAVNDVSFHLQQGKITALLGPNGAGKTTIFNLVTGTVKPDSGKVVLRDQEITRLSSTAVAKRGIARSFQDVRAYQRLTALQNVAIAVPNQPGENPLLLLPGMPWALKAERRTRRIALEALGFVGLADKANETVGNLSFGDQKLVAIARLLATECEVLLLDEPTSGVDPANVDNVIKVILDLKRLGRTICLVEHSVHFVQQLADWVIFLDQGKVIARGTMAELTGQKHLTEIYFGT
jgi:branched-chain amino acid transport system ATP-binding protein/branched-chain amino acid transport system permease protein